MNGSLRLLYDLNLVKGRTIMKRYLRTILRVICLVSACALVTMMEPGNFGGPSNPTLRALAQDHPINQG